MHTYFKSVETKNDDGWMMGHFGCSSIDNKDYTLTTQHLKADEVPAAMMDAKTSTQLIATLLNAFYSCVDISQKSEEEVIAMAEKLETGEIPDQANPTLPFPEIEVTIPGIF